MSNERITSSFGEFFESWEEQHRSYLEKLLALHHQIQIQLDADQVDSLVQHVLRHFQDYYDEKAKAAQSDVFLIFSPPWFSSYERTLLWVSGFKPSVMFRIVNESVGVDQLNEDQKERIAVLREETRRMEREIGGALASLQESVAAPTMCGLLKRELVDGEVSDMENVIEEFKAAMLAVMRDADDLRQRTGLQLLEVLSPVQKVKFMAGTLQFWLRSRRLGMERDRQRTHLNNISASPSTSTSLS